jgi:hypothetical protein
MTERTYTLDEANAELHQLGERLPRLREARQGLIRASERISAKVAADGGGVDGRDYFDHERALRDELTWLADRGILLRDPETGLVDFLGEHEGRRVYLCWRLGEDTVGFWHELSTGFTGRRPL